LASDGGRSVRSRPSTSEKTATVLQTRWDLSLIAFSSQNCRRRERTFPHSGNHDERLRKFVVSLFENVYASEEEFCSP